MGFVWIEQSRKCDILMVFGGVLYEEIEVTRPNTNTDIRNTEEGV